jgi:hypothetical protein
MTLRAETNFQFAVADEAGARLVIGQVLPNRVIAGPYFASAF